MSLSVNLVASFGAAATVAEPVGPIGNGDPIGAGKGVGNNNKPSGSLIGGNWP